MERAELAAALREHAYLEGDFVLRSGRRSSYYLDKYRFETRPELLAPLGEALAGRGSRRGARGRASRRARAGRGRAPAQPRSASGLPFLIVRKEPKGYGTDNRLEGVSEAGELVCLVEDVVTSGGAAAGAVEALRDADLTVRHAVCVVDREEGGSDALARLGVRLVPLFRVSDLAEAGKSAANPHG